MKKRVLLISLILISILFMSSFTYESGDDAISDFEELLPDGAELNEEDIISELSIESLISKLISAVSLGASDALSLFLLLLGIVALTVIAEIAPPFENSSLRGHISASVAIISSLVIFSRIFVLVDSVGSGIESISSFFGSAIPIFTGILYAGGYVKSAAAGAMNMNLTLAVIGIISSRLLLPVCCAVFALALLSGIDTGGISRLTKSVKGFFSWVLGILTASLAAVFSMQSLVTSAADTAYLRAAKYAASGMIPIVGSTVSSALGALAGGLSYAKSIVGVGACAVIVGIAISPLVKLLLYRLAFSFAFSFAEFLDSGTSSRLLSSYRAALDVLISVYVMTIIVYITEVIVFVKSAGGVF